jgi:hypothetical protein
VPRAAAVAGLAPGRAAGLPQYHRDGMDVAPDGIHDVASEKYRSLHQSACRPASAGGSSASNAMQTNIGMICD